MKKLKRAVIKEELVELTGDFRPALILNQFIYGIERMYDTDKYILEEKERALKHCFYIIRYSEKIIHTFFN